LRGVRDELGLATALGVSNISFGLPNRSVLSSAFFTMAIEAGLCAAIINPKEERMMDAYRSAMVLLNHDQRAEQYISCYANTVSAPATTVSETAGIRERLTAAIIEGDVEGIVSLVETALTEGLSSLQVSNEGLLPGLEEVGRRFGKNQIFLPQVMLSAETMQAAFARLKQESGADAVAPIAKILMATVEGDIHDIGKNIVCTLLENHGFEVYDLGKNVAAKKILDEALRLKVDAVGLSALMTTTLQQMEVTIALLRDAGIKVLTMVGGAVVTQDYADEIKADLYAEDALEAVQKIKELFAVKSP
jgi:5-methyltetrahydrofolate--homocysteine methyltransferase